MPRRDKGSLGAGPVEVIRAQAAIGAGLVVVTMGGLIPDVVEAARVCGRTGALRMMYLNEQQLSGIARASTARRATDDGLPWLGLPDEARERLAGAARNLPGRDLLEPLGEEEALAPGAIVVVAGNGSLANDVGRRLLALADAGAVRERRGRPAFLSDVVGVGEPEPGHWDEVGIRTDRGMSVLMTFGDIAHARDALAEGAGPWLDADAAYDAAIRIEVDGDESWGWDGGRLALVRRIPDGRAEAFVITPDEGCSHADVEAGGAGRDFCANLARACLRQGPGNVSPIGGAWVRWRASHCLESLFDDRLAPSGRGTLAARAAVDRELWAVLGSEGGGDLLASLVSRAEPGTRERRRQFVLSWPCCCRALLDPEFRAGVDAGRETVPLVAGWLGMPVAAARRLVGVRGGQHWSATIFKEHAGPVLGALGHGSYPARGGSEDWRAFLSLLGEVYELCLANGDELPDPAVTAALVGDLPGRTWEDRLDVLGSSRFGPFDAGDMVRGLSRWLSALSGGPVGTRAALAMLASGGGGLVRIDRDSDVWHANPALSRDAGDVPPDATWPVPFDPVNLGEGWEAVALSGVRELQDEGADGPDASGIHGLSHCVAGYGFACLHEGSLIVSIRHRRGANARRVSTAELRRGTGPWRIAGVEHELAQHKGIRNSAPEPEAAHRLGILRERLASDAVEIRPGALDPRPAGERSAPDREAALALLDAWRRILPAPYRRMDADALAEAAREIGRA